MSDLPHHDAERAAERRRLAGLWMSALPSVQSFVAAAVRDFHHAEDVVQQVAEEAAERFDRYDSARPFIAWVIQIARHRVALHYRKLGRDRLTLCDRSLDLVADAHVAHHADLPERHDALRLCLDALDAKPRRLIELRYRDSQTAAQIAAAERSTANSVRVMLTRLRSRLLDCIKSKLAGSAGGAGGTGGAGGAGGAGGHAS